MNMLHQISVGTKNKSKQKPVQTILPDCQELTRFLREQELPRAKYSETGTGDNCKITCGFHRYQAQASGTKDEAMTPFFITANNVYSPEWDMGGGIFRKANFKNI